MLRRVAFLLAACLVPLAAAAQEGASQGVPVAAQGVPVAAPGGAAPAADPCGFYRARAYGKGIDHYAAEVVWACEAVTRRREAGMAMNDRLLAVAHALERYREELVQDRRRRVVSGARGSRHRAEEEAAHRGIAEATGMLAALDAIRGGF